MKSMSRRISLDDAMPHDQKILLSIAGFDPSSGAGVTADLKVFAAHHFYGMACITALTVQSTQGVQAVEPVSAKMIASTLAFMAEDVTFAGIKIGMLGTEEAARAVLDYISAWPQTPIVLDPVLRSTSGRELLNEGGVAVLRDELLRRIQWVTPNLAELSVLTGSTVITTSHIENGAKLLQKHAENCGNKHLNVLVTGGHREVPDDFLLSADGEARWLPGKRVETQATHGTGCALSSALLCGVVQGKSPFFAADEAKRYVTTALEKAYPIGQGNGPMNHLFAFDRDC